VAPENTQNEATPAKRLIKNSKPNVYCSWSIADDSLRDLILPMIILRRLEVLLEPSKDKMLEEPFSARRWDC